MYEFFPFVVILYTTLIGLFLGSFTTMLIHRLHFEEKGIIAGRSRCPKCNHTLGVQNLIPVFSWVFQKGQCAFCKEKISPFYPAVEATFGITFFVFAQKFYTEAWFIPIMIAVFFCLIFFFYDLRFFEVDQRLTIPVIAALFVWSFFREESWQFYLIGGGIGFFFYAIQYWISKGKWVGDGDQQLGLFMGILLGWKFVIGALFLAYIIGMISIIPLIITKKADGKTPLPMGAFLMPATLIFLYNGEALWGWYIHIMRLDNFVL